MKCIDIQENLKKYSERGHCIMFLALLGQVTTIPVPQDNTHL